MDSATVMIVDDTPANLAFLSDALDDAGYRVLVAVDGRSALQQLELARPDIILLDAVMPGLDGFQTCRIIKSSRQHSRIPVIFMTALDDSSAVVRGFSEGAEDYVTKPINEEEILARISSHLLRARSTSRVLNTVDILIKSGLTVSSNGYIIWKTDNLDSLIKTYFSNYDAAAKRLPDELNSWLSDLIEHETQNLEHKNFFRQTSNNSSLIIQYGGMVNNDEILFIFKEEIELSPALLKSTYSLTPRESEVLYWLAYGKTNRDIGEILGMSPRTVNKHLEHIFVKLGVETRTAAASRAIKCLENLEAG